LRPAACVLPLLALAACAVGPNFAPPPAPQTSGYDPDAPPAQTASVDAPGGEVQRFQAGRDLPGQWWTLFGSPKLDALIKAAMANYPDIAAQQAALRSARESTRAQAGVFLPQVQGQGTGVREQEPGTQIGPGYSGFITNVYEASLSASYPIDLFGGERRQLENVRAQEEAQAYQLEVSYLTLTANVAAAAIQAASIQDQIAATQQIVAIEQKQLGFIQRQFDLGARTRADILQQQSNLDQVAATLPTLRQQLKAVQHQLAVLTGQFPHEAQPVGFELADFRLPQDLPVSLPSALVAQRPDVRAQEAILHQASAAVGVATANMLPQITLTGSLGSEAFTLSKLAQPDAELWTIGAGLTQPLFQGGALNARRRAAIDNYDAAGARYRLVVLQAFQSVADALTALDNDAEAFKIDAGAVAAANASLDLIQRQYDDGAANYTSLLAAQQAYQQARIAYVQAMARRYADTVGLFQALGGGWWNRADPGVKRAAADTSPLSLR
jgi:NodT family efflux transporter outer membrane factor (OMF) lipoprotein